jgi:hypothetical protein
MSKCNVSKTDPTGTSVKGRDGSQVYYMATDEFYPMKTPYLDFAYGIHEGFQGIDSIESAPQPILDINTELTPLPPQTATPFVDKINEKEVEPPFVDKINDNGDDIDIILPKSKTYNKICPDVTCPQPICPKPVCSPTVCPKLDYTWLQANFIAVMILLIIIILVIIMNRR